YRVITQIVTDTVSQSLALRERDEFFPFLYARRQRLFADHMLPCLECFFRHRKMLCVRRADVDRIDRPVSHDLAIVACNGWDGESRTQTPRRIEVSSRDCSHFHELDPSHCFQVHPPHKASADDRRFDCSHSHSLCVTPTRPRPAARESQCC